MKKLKIFETPYKTYLWIFLAAVLSRWAVFLFAWAVSGSGTSFFDAVYSVFIKAGDTPHYIEIARNGYSAAGDTKNLIVFFPFYPVLIKLLAFVVQSFFASGLIISNICSGIGACVFYELLRLDFDEDSSCFGLMLMLLFPFSFFTAAVYTEGLFLLLCSAALYCMRKKYWIYAAVFGFLCALTRIQGMILAFAFAYELLVDFSSSKKLDKKSAAAVLAPLLGYFVYLLINRLVYGDWFIYLDFQADEPWYNEAHWISSNIAQHYDMAVQYKHNLAMYIYFPQIILFFAGTAALLLGIKRRIRTSYIVFGGAYMAVTYFHGWQISGGRYMSMCLPLFIIAASCKSRTAQYALLGVSALFYTALAVLWFKGYSIM